MTGETTETLDQMIDTLAAGPFQGKTSVPVRGFEALLWHDVYDIIDE